MGQYQELEELRKSFLLAYEEGDWDLALKLQMQIMHVLQEDDSPDTEEVARGMHNLGVVLDEMEELEKAEVCYERSANAKRMCNGATMSLADTLNNLGIVRHKMKKHKEGLDAHEEVLAIQNRYLEKNNPERVQTLWHLGYGYEAYGVYEKAIKSLEEVLQWAGRGAEYTKLELARIYGEIAKCYEKVGNYKKGIYAYERALHWLEKIGEADSLFSMEYMWGLSGLCESSGYGDLAVEYGEKALVLEESKYRKDDMSHLQSLDRLASLCKKCGEYEKSIALHQKILDIVAKWMGIESDYYRNGEIEMAQCYFYLSNQQTEDKRAKSLQKSIDILENVMAKNQRSEEKNIPQAMTVSALMTTVEHERGNHAQDMKHLERMALEFFWELDLKDFWAMEALLLGAKLLYETGIYGGALYCGNLILKHGKKRQAYYIETLYLLGEVWDVMGWQEGRVASAQMAKDLTEDLYPYNHPEVAKSWKHLGRAYQDAEDFIHAKRYLKKALEVETIMLDEDNPSRVDTLMNLAEVCFWKGDYEESVAYLQERNDLNFEETKEDLLEASIVLVSIGIAYLAMGEDEKAIAYAKESERKWASSGLEKNDCLCQQERIYGKLMEGAPINYMEETKHVQESRSVVEAKIICKNLESVLEVIQKSPQNNGEKLTFAASCIAGIYANAGEYKDALCWYQKAEKWGEDDRYLLACIAVGRMLVVLGENEKALYQFVNAKEYILEYREMEAISLCAVSGYIGDTHFMMGETELAVQAYIGWERKCRNLHLSSGKRYIERTSRVAEILEGMGNFNLAINWYEKNRDILAGCCPKGEAYARVQLKLVELLLHKERPETCLGMLNEILALGQNKNVRGYTPLSAETFDRLGQLYFTLEEEGKAWEALVLAYEGSKNEQQSMSKEGLWIFFQLLREKE